MGRSKVISKMKIIKILFLVGTMSDTTDAKSTNKVKVYGNKARHEHPAKGLPRHPAPGRHIEPPPRDDDGRQDGHSKYTWNSKFGPTGGRNEIDEPDSLADEEQGVRYHI